MDLLSQLQNLHQADISLNSKETQTDVPKTPVPQSNLLVDRLKMLKSKKNIKLSFPLVDTEYVKLSSPESKNEQNKKYFINHCNFMKFMINPNKLRFDT